MQCTGPETVVLMTVQGSPLDTSLNDSEMAGGMQTPWRCMGNLAASRISAIGTLYDTVELDARWDAQVVSVVTGISLRN
jgi:hypothetical protein